MDSRPLGDKNSSTYVFTHEAVRRGLEALIARSSHEHFPGYLAILQAKYRDGNTNIGVSDIVEFHDRLLKVQGASEDAPYLRPFRSRRGQGGSEFLNRNVSGSYAPSSIRDGRRLSNVVDVIGGNRNGQFTLKIDHESLALNHLLGDVKMAFPHLAVFLYRDFGFKLEEVSIEQTFAIARADLGIGPETEDGQRIFEKLFDSDLSMYSDTDLEIVIGEHNNE